LIDGYEYNATSNRCEKSPLNNALKIENQDYNFLMGFTGLVCGVIIALTSFTALKSA